MNALSYDRNWTGLHYGILAVLIATAAWMLRGPLADIVRIAVGDREQSHILLAPFVSVWLAWVYRGRIKRIRYTPSAYGPIVIAIGWLMNWLGFETDTWILRHAAVIVILVGVVVSLIGIRAFIGLLPVFLPLLLALPIPGTIRTMISWPLQGFATSWSYEVLNWFGVEVERQQFLLIISGTAVNIGEACNGLRMIFALILVTIAFAFSQPLRTSSRMLLILYSPVLAVLCNVIRLVPTALIYGYGEAQTAEQFHDFAGWVMLPIALFVLFGVVRLGRWLELPVMQWKYSA